MKIVLITLSLLASLSSMAASNVEVCSIVSGTTVSSDTTHATAVGIKCLNPSLTNLKIAEYDDTAYGSDKVKAAALESRMKVIKHLLMMDFSKQESDLYVKTQR